MKRRRAVHRDSGRDEISLVTGISVFAEIFVHKKESIALPAVNTAETDELLHIPDHVVELLRPELSLRPELRVQLNAFVEQTDSVPALLPIYNVNAHDLSPFGNEKRRIRAMASPSFV
jgi:hypothetical protein